MAENQQQTATSQSQGLSTTQPATPPQSVGQTTQPQTPQQSQQQAAPTAQTPQPAQQQPQQITPQPQQHPQPLIQNQQQQSNVQVQQQPSVQVTVHQVTAQQQAAVQHVQQQQAVQQAQQHAAVQQHQVQQVQQQQVQQQVQQQQVLQPQQSATPTITPLNTVQGMANLQNLQSVQNLQGVQNNAAAATIMPVSNSMMSLSGNVTPVFSGGQMVANPMNANAMANAMTVNAANLRNAIPQVQVIPQMHNSPFMQQFPYNQQQFMIQNAAAMQAMQANAMNMNMSPQQINMANMNMAMAMQRQGLTNQALMSPSPTTPTQVSNLTFSAIPAQVSNSNTTTTANGKMAQNNKGQMTPSGQTQQAQATTLIGGKPIMPTQANIAGTPVVLGGGTSKLRTCVLPNQLGGQGFVTQSKGGSVAVSINQSGQTQLITTQAPIRFSQPQLVSSTGQLISSTPIMTNQAVLQAMANLQQQSIPINNQTIMGAQGQSPTIISGQGLYIRAANPLQGQQGIMAATGVQTISAAMKGTPQNIVKASVTGMQINKTGQNVQVGKALLPIKTVTARVNPTNVQKGKVMVTTAQKTASRGRPRTVNRMVGAMTASAATNTVASALQSKAAAGANLAKITSPKQVSALPSKSANKSEADGESCKKNSSDINLDRKLEDKIDRSKMPDSSKSGDKDVKMEVSDNGKTQGKGNTPVVIEKQKAIVKPQILTHVIEGFIIQEGPEPFPVQRSSLLTEFIPPKQTELDNQSQGVNEDEEAETSQKKPPRDPPPEFFSKCEFCGSEEQAARFKRSTRFCTMACAKRYNVAHRMSMFKPRGKPGRPPGSGRGIMKKRALLNLKKGWRPKSEQMEFSEEEKNMEENAMEEGQNEDAEPQSTSVTSENESSSAPDSPTMTKEEDMDTNIPQTSPAKWTVTEVYEFVKSMPGCLPYAEEFKSQEIDGQALMLLKEDHLMTTMSMKLGPALKICAKINSMKSDSP